MKQIIISTIALFVSVAAVSAQNKTTQQVVTAYGITAEDVIIKREGSKMSLAMRLNLADLHLPSNRAYLITPCLISSSDTLRMHSVGIYGHRRYYYYQRNYGDNMLSGPEEQSYKDGTQPKQLDYKASANYEGWMNNTCLTLKVEEFVCCGQVINEATGVLVDCWRAEPAVFRPQYVYITPEAESVKMRCVEGEAKVDFPVNKMEIYADYHDNQNELNKIRRSIDNARGDHDITITSVWLKGFASPESPYNHNAMLAKGRTEAIKRYISQMYAFDSGVIVTEYEAENWEGLRTYVQHGHLEHANEILDIIDCDMTDLDAKEKLIKSRYPAKYRFLLTNCYPQLRRTLYRINYTVRTYSDISEIRRVLKTHPQNLSLNELYLASQGLEPGGEEFTEVFETAVRMFPDDATANLNAANAAMQRADFTAASRYLEKAGSTPQAVYARAILATHLQNYDEAERLFTESEAAGILEAGNMIQQIKDLRNNNQK